MTIQGVYIIIASALLYRTTSVARGLSCCRGQLEYFIEDNQCSKGTDVEDNWSVARAL